MINIITSLRTTFRNYITHCCQRSNHSHKKNALVKLLFKKGDHRELKNWRPVSLLNTDYKILSKILTNRISTVLSMIVPEEQKYGINGRKMNDVIRNLASYKYHAMNGFFVLVDQAKAFDRVKFCHSAS